MLSWSPEVGGRIGEDIGGVSHGDATAETCCEVDVVDADGVVRDDPQIRGTVEQRRVDTVGEHRKQAVGFTDPPMPGTIFAENNVRVASLSDAEIKKAEEMCSPEYQPQLWEQWRERINGWAGGIDTYQDIYNEVRKNPHTLAENVEPRRWWKG